MPENRVGDLKLREINIELLETLVTLILSTLDYCRKHNIPITEDIEPIERLIHNALKVLHEADSEDKIKNSRPEDFTEPKKVIFLI